MRNPFKRKQPELVETRSVTSVPWDQGGPANPAQLSQDQALSLSYLFAANRLLASSISTLPLKSYQVLGDERRPSPTLPRLFRDLKESGQMVFWLHRLVESRSLRGNSVGYVTDRDAYGHPIAVVWLNPSDVSVDDSAAYQRPQWYVLGRPVPFEDIIHIPYFPQAGKVWSMSPLGAFMSTFSTGLQAQSYGNDWFRGGGFPPGTFRNTQKTVDQAEADVIKARLGRAMETRRPLVFGNDWEYEPITVPPNEAQFVETMKLTANQIAAIYGIPPDMIGGEAGSSNTYQNVEQQSINFVTYTLRPWLVTLEAVFSSLLPQGQEVKFNADALVRADLKTRWTTYQIARQIGAKSVDEIRALEDEQPLPNGEGKDYAPLKGASPAPQLESGSSDEPAAERPTGRWLKPA